jgi:putative transposase
MQGTRHSQEFIERTLSKARQCGSHTLVQLATELNLSEGALKGRLRTRTTTMVSSACRAVFRKAARSISGARPSACWPCTKAMACTLPRCTPDAARRACSSSRSCPGAKLFGPARSRHRQRRGAAKVKFKALQGQQEMLQRDLRRKARALAEAAALQVPKKISSAVGGRGRMTCPEQRQTRLRLIQDVCTAGARLGRAWGQIGLSARTVQRWQRPEWPDGDRRVAGLHERAALAKNPSRAERDAALQIVDGNAFRNLPPSQIVPRLTDQGRDGTSVSALYRLLQLAGKIAHRRLERVRSEAQQSASLDGHAARSNLLLGHSIYLPTQVRGAYVCLYLFADLFSRKTVGWQVCY